MNGVVCGDHCGWWNTPEIIVVAVADGLGHGPEAALAAEMAMMCIESSLGKSLEQLFLYCQENLQSTRGVALTVAFINKKSGLTKLASVGNIRTILIKKDKDYRFGSARGIVGGGYGRLNPEEFIICPGDVLALFSDGLDEFTDVRKALLENVENVENVEQSNNHAAYLLEKLAGRADDAALLLYHH
jgi:serine phosphatase RsbU (regulator of sigma subunit)